MPEWILAHVSHFLTDRLTPECFHSTLAKKPDWIFLDQDKSDQAQ